MGGRIIADEPKLFGNRQWRQRERTCALLRREEQIQVGVGHLD